MKEKERRGIGMFGGGNTYVIIEMICTRTNTSIGACSSSIYTNLYINR